MEEVTTMIHSNSREELANVIDPNAFASFVPEDRRTENIQAQENAYTIADRIIAASLISSSLTAFPFPANQMLPLNNYDEDFSPFL